MPNLADALWDRVGIYTEASNPLRGEGEDGWGKNSMKRTARKSNIWDVNK